MLRWRRNLFKSDFVLGKCYIIDDLRYVFGFKFNFIFQKLSYKSFSLIFIVKIHNWTDYRNKSKESNSPIIKPPKNARPLIAPILQYKTHPSWRLYQLPFKRVTGRCPLYFARRVIEGNLKHVLVGQDILMEGRVAFYSIRSGWCYQKNITRG